MQVKTSPKIEKFLISAAGQRFLKFVGMLGSDADGERANASGMANRLLRKAELTWGEVLGSGPAPSQGGQQTAINNLVTRLRIAQDQLAASQRQVGALTANLRRANEMVALLSQDIAGMKKAAAGPEKPASAGTRSKPNRGGDRAYATDFQRDLNETLDDISAAIDLNEWEQGFIENLRNYKLRLTEKQWNHLNRLARQAHVEVKVERP